MASLNNRLIVVGNGLDLYCGLHTTYGDFFEKQRSGNSTFSKACKLLKKMRVHESPDLFEKEIDNLTAQCPFGEDFTIWDLMFILLSKESKDFKTNYHWCDIEELISNSLLEPPHFQLSWAGVLWSLNKQLNPNCVNAELASWQDKVIAASLLKDPEMQKIMGGSQIETKDFYDFLLGKLELFEKRFGKFITRTRTKDLDGDALEKAKVLYEKLATKGFNNVEVDTFNYSDIFEAPHVRFLHGSVREGDLFFGIKENNQLPPAALPFTKGYRVGMLSRKNQVDGLLDFQSVIIFGHSLSQGDYDYFFSLLSRLGFTAATPYPDVKIQVLYFPYRHNEGRYIRSAFVELISEYAKMAGIPYGYFSRLMYVGKIVFRELPQEPEDILQNIDFYFEKVRQ
jgi:hypothetical protein